MLVLIIVMIVLLQSLLPYVLDVLSVIVIIQTLDHVTNVLFRDVQPAQYRPVLNALMDTNLLVINVSHVLLVAQLVSLQLVFVQHVEDN